MYEYNSLRAKRIEAAVLLAHLHSWDSGGASYKDDLIHLIQVEVSVLQRPFDRYPTPVQQVTAHVFKLGTGDGLLDVLGSFCCCCDEGQGDAGLSQLAQFHLGLLSCFSQTLQSLHSSRRLGTEHCVNSDVAVG